MSVILFAKYSQVMKARNRNITTVCRTCMTTKHLSPIFSEDTDYEMYSEILLNTTGLKVKLYDGLPQQICTACTKFINNSMKFRKQCKATEALLLRLINQSEMSKFIKAESFEESTRINSFDTKKTESKEVKNEGRETNNLKHTVETAVVTKSISKLVSDVRNNQFDESIVTINQPDISIDIITESDKMIDTISQSGKRVGVITQSDNSIGTISQPGININTICQSGKRIGAISQSDKGISTISQPTKGIGTNSQPDNISGTAIESDTLIGKNKAIIDIDRVTCRLCNKNLLQKSLLRHMRKIHGDTEQNIVLCGFCDQIISKGDLNNHIAVMHNNTTVFRCGYCNAKFEAKEKLLEHQSSFCIKKKRRVASRTGKHLVECSECDKVMRASSLAAHTSVAHRGVRPVCEHCGHRSGNKRRLEEHLRAKHGYDKFTCNQCDFTSASAVAMQDHERRHRGDKPFVCELCGARFHAAYLLRQHTHTHRTARPAKCMECPASFKSTNALSSHRARTHKRLGRRPHPNDGTSVPDTKGHVT